MNYEAVVACFNIVLRAFLTRNKENLHYSRQPAVREFNRTKYRATLTDSRPPGSVSVNHGNMRVKKIHER
jgi:hypothetical protein